jgi:hypothetical protein
MQRERDLRSAGFVCTNLDCAHFFVLFFGSKFEERRLRIEEARGLQVGQNPTAMKTSLANLH